MIRASSNAAMDGNSKNLRPRMTYAKRLAAAAEKDDVYVYDQAPPALRQQIVYLLRDVIGGYHIRNAAGTLQRAPGAADWDHVHDAAVRELGRAELPQGMKSANKADAVELAITYERYFNYWMTVVEIAIQRVDTVVRDRRGGLYPGAKMTAAEALEDINTRFRENGVGLQFEGGIFTRVDSDFLHQSATRPALHLMRTEGFDGAREEFLRAHERYREGKFESALQEALKAAESVLKSIHDKRSWEYDKRMPFKKLLLSAKDHGLFPASMEDYYLGGLEKLLVSGLPAQRNQAGGGHGQGSTPKPIPSHVCGFALHQAASNIVFLVESYRALS